MENLSNNRITKTNETTWYQIHTRRNIMFGNFKMVQDGECTTVKIYRKIPCCIWSQDTIGLHKTCNEKLSQHWLEHQGNTKTITGQV